VFATHRAGMNVDYEKQRDGFARGITIRYAEEEARNTMELGLRMEFYFQFSFSWTRDLDFRSDNVKRERNISGNLLPSSFLIFENSHFQAYRLGFFVIFVI